MSESHTCVVPGSLIALLLISAGRTVPAQAPAAMLPSSLPPQFVANRGQWQDGAQFLLTTGGTHAWVEDRGFLLQAERGELGCAVRFRFAGSAGAPEGADRQPTLRHWLRSEACGGPVVDVPAFARVVQRGLYESLDLVLRTQDGHLEYDLLCAPGAQLGQVVVAVEGHDGMRIGADGSLVLDTALGELRQPPPVTWTTDAAGGQERLPSHYVLIDDSHFGFAVDGWVAGALTIDPSLVWGGFLGGVGIDSCAGVDVDSTGSAVVAGTTNSANLPTTVGAYRTTAVGGTDAFVAKVSADGSTLQFCTYLGGTFDESASAVQVLSGDRIAVAGQTASGNFPVTGNRYQPINGGATDGFVAVVSPTGAQLQYGSYFGGTGADSDIRMRVQPNEDIWLAGRCLDSTPTTANAYQPTNHSQGVGEAFFAVLNRQNISSTTLRYGTYFGGTGDEISVDSIQVGLDSFGNEIASIGLTTNSAGIATSPNAYQTAIVGSSPTGFIVQFDPAAAVPAASLVYASYFGAAGGSTTGLRVAPDSAGLLAVCATTSSPNWTTAPIAYQRIYGGGASDVLCARFDPSRGTGALVFATYFGGSLDETAEAMVYLYQAGTSDLMTFVGSTTSTNLPTTPSALQRAFAGTGRSGFVGQIDFRLFLTLQLKYASLFDGCGAGDEVLRGVHRAASGELTVAGTTTSPFAPVSAGSFQAAPGGGSEGIVARLGLAGDPASFAAFGTGCGQPGQVPVMTAGQPARICQPFDVNLTNLLPNTGGFMVLGFSNTAWFGVIPLPRDLAGDGMPGCNQYIDTELLSLVLWTGTSTTWGMTVPPSQDFYGVTFYLQFFMADAAANPFGFVSTNAAALNIHY